MFDSAIRLLDGSDESETKSAAELPQLPPRNQRIFKTAGAADVFGGMGSWNDTPSYMAHSKGMMNEYNELSGELLKNLRIHVRCE